MPAALKSPCNHPGCRTACPEPYCAKHKAAHPAWRSRGKERQTSTQRGYGRRWQLLRRYILDRDKGLCQPCRRGDLVVVATEVDHIVPKSKGGTDDETNLQAICTGCHDAKTKRETAEARQAHAM